MRTTLNIDDALIEKASKLTGIIEKTALVRKGLETLISLESSRRCGEIRYIYSSYTIKLKSQL